MYIIICFFFQFMGNQPHKNTESLCNPITLQEQCRQLQDVQEQVHFFVVHRMNELQTDAAKYEQIEISLNYWRTEAVSDLTDVSSNIAVNIEQVWDEYSQSMEEKYTKTILEMLVWLNNKTGLWTTFWEQIQASIPETFGRFLMELVHKHELTNLDLQFQSWIRAVK